MGPAAVAAPSPAEPATPGPARVLPPVSVPPVVRLVAGAPAFPTAALALAWAVAAICPAGDTAFRLGPGSVPVAVPATPAVDPGLPGAPRAPTPFPPGPMAP